MCVIGVVGGGGGRGLGGRGGEVRTYAVSSRRARMARHPTSYILHPTSYILHPAHFPAEEHEWHDERVIDGKGHRDEG